MKQLKEKVIQLGIERGYLPEHDHDGVDKKFTNQFLRLLEEKGEMAREVRLSNQTSFEMEYGDVQVLLTNCEYIFDNYICDNQAVYSMLENVRLEIDTIVMFAETEFSTIYGWSHDRKHCLQLAYDKIKERGGILIGNDYFKPTDPEYIDYFKNKQS